MKNLDCPHCGDTMIKSYEDEAKFRLKLIKWTNKGMFAVCKGCNGEIRIGVDLLKSIESQFVFEVEADKKD